MRVTVIQTSPGTDRSTNLARVTSLVSEACRSDRPDLVVLPEMWTCLGGDRATKLAAAEALPVAGGPDARAGSTDDGPVVAALRTIARREQIVLHGGSIGERAPDGRLFNTTLVIGRDGRELCRYRKIHMFDVTTPSGVGYRESDLFAAGDEVAVFEADGVIAGCAICYDLRFPPLFARLRERGAELILLPAAFTAETGAAHWEALVRARAIETQCWIAAAATTGRHDGPGGSARLTWGHSMVADPWGHVVASLVDGEGWASTVVDPELTARVRRDFPVWAHRRLA